MKNTWTGKKVLAIRMGENDANAKTVKAYLRALLTELWSEVEGFSGKRPFGNSGWEHELYWALVNANAVEGSLDDDGYLADYDKDAADALIFEAIDAL